ncbi:unnamed protein product [Mesocestoides corti]|uniref:Uncharacterized protein n=1 Tax=Mesocestoides corti TaxID=53468 RepID=A0A0R3UP23_MESCO|nr:unnamed protein product [Mesocestoides corti]
MQEGQEADHLACAIKNYLLIDFLWDKRGARVPACGGGGGGVSFGEMRQRHLHPINVPPRSQKWFNFRGNVP